MVDGQKDLEARLVAKGYRVLASKDGVVETPRRVSRRSSYLQIIFPGLWGNVAFGPWTSSMPPSNAMALIAMFRFAFLRDGALGAFTVFQNCARRCTA